METLFIAREAKLKRQDNTLFIHANGRKTPFPIEKLRHIVLLGEAAFNSRLLELCGQHGVRVSVFDYYGYYRGSFEPSEQNPAGRVKLEQAALVLDDNKRIAVARELVRGAAHNMRALLAYYAYRKIAVLDTTLKDMDKLNGKIGKAANSEQLMGIEGNLHQSYYAAWGKVDKRLDFVPRVRRPPNNPVNCLISFLNQMVYTVTRHEACKTHLEESFAFLHSPGQGRSSLSLDLAEPFKPVLSHALIFKMIRKGMINDNWFEQQEGICLLSETGRRHVAEQFSIRLEEQYQGRSYREWLYREALNIERHLLGVAEYEAFKRKA
ncbi:CRISPR-associated endonuclease Cas1 [Candidatus Venteria ishoeyi]|uniref:CRISPR-associated endonuclease Cas1 n=2 Tax=Candidatus Venteria ishoeyi TaxID=1899563 RepID=A0A1H6FAP2_9GAMM|nr:CRISPR-associated endonuclease Cas1 [Candidatus Venteria ishoeyi]